MQLSALKVWSAPLLLLVTTGTMALSISPYNSSIDFNHTLSKRDPSGVPADIFSEGCALKNPKFAVPKSNPGIQVGECYVNSRIMKQKFCIFEPDAARITASLEGGPYGTCSCYDQFPKATDLMSFENLNYACMAWTKNSGGGTAPAIPGTKCIPFPIVCPTSLIKSSKGCYSKNYFAQGGPATLIPFANTKPTCKMYWSPEKSLKDSKDMFCTSIDGGCEVPTNLQLVTRNFTCDTSKCKKYTGSLKPLDASHRSSGTSSPSAGGSTANATTPAPPAGQPTTAAPAASSGNSKKGKSSNSGSAKASGNTKTGSSGGSGGGGGLAGLLSGYFPGGGGGGGSHHSKSKRHRSH